MLPTEKFKELVMKQTALMQRPAEQPNVVADKSGLSEKAVKVYDVLAENRAPAYIYKLMSTLLGEDIPVIKREINPGSQGFYPFSCVVPVSNPNSHNYTKGVPCVLTFVGMTSSNKAMRYDGSTGNNLPKMSLGNSRSPVIPATEEQINEFFEKFGKRTVKLTSEGRKLVEAIEAGNRITCSNGQAFG